jgi:hypothetical protein
MRNTNRQLISSAGLLVGVLLVLMASAASGQTVTGQWDFNDPNNPLGATVGSDGYFWARPDSNQSGEVEFGTAGSFGISPVPGGDSGVMKFPAFDPFNGIAVWHGMNANGGGWYVNQYTIIYDLLFPAESDGQWRSLWQTNECNWNDGDFFVNPSGGIGISSDYEGQILVDTWHRVALAVNCDPNTAPPAVDKYIDGAYVGSTDLDGLDGRWTLYTQSDGLPTLLLADESNDTAGGYLNSFQIRDYTMTAAEVEALGGVTAAGIPAGSGVAGLWNFDNPVDGLAATVGNDLEYFNRFTFGCMDPNCPQDLSVTTEFGTTSDYPEVPDLPDGPAALMRFDAAIPCQGYMFPHGAAANGEYLDPNNGLVLGNRVNNYTIIADLFYTYDDFYNPPEGHSPDWTPIYQTWEMNDGDAMLWVYIQGGAYEDGSIGDEAEYADTGGWIQPDTWMRVVAAVAFDADDPVDDVTVTKYVLYADDTHVGPVKQPTWDEWLDDKRALRTDEEVGEDVLFLFTNDWEDPVYTHRGFVSSIQVRDYTMTEAEVLALGGPRAAGIPGAPGCVGDVDGDGDTDLADLAALLGAYGSSVGDPDYNENADFEPDGDVDLADLAYLLGDYGCE